MAHVEREKAAGLVALGRADPEARAAFEHAEGCEECVRLLRRSSAALGLLDSLPPAEPPSHEALDRTSSAILAKLGSPEEKPGEGAAPVTRARGVWKVAPIAATVVVWGLYIAIARYRTMEPRLWIESFAAIVIAGVSARIATSGGRWLVLMSAVASAGLASTGSMSPDLAAMLGAKCVIMELAGAAIPFFLAARLVKDGGIRPTIAVFVGVAGAGALAAQAALQVVCMAQSGLAHEWIFHFGGVALAMGLAFAFGRRFIPREQEAQRA
jgi:hypothetical protein